MLISWGVLPALKVECLTRSLGGMSYMLLRWDVFLALKVGYLISS